jgi:ornithine carbamoyltransferase
MKRDFLGIADWSTADLHHLIDATSRIKQTPGLSGQILGGRSIAMIFEKQSLRTHVTFDVAIHQLGGHPIYLTQADISLGKRESISDTGKNLERWVHGIVVRTFAHSGLAELARVVKVPVVNALTDLEHPCQAVADIFTLCEKWGSLRGRKLVFVGDGNNVCHSLMLLAAHMGMKFVAAVPRGYEPDQHLFMMAAAAAKEAGGSVDLSHIPREAVHHADAVYTDVWVSMGQEEERERKMEAFREFQVNPKLMAHARHDALFMHCLPAHRGEEVTDAVIDSPQSVVFDQAENRLHSEKAILSSLCAGD